MPTVYFLQICRASCAACPFGGICVIAIPLIFGIVVLLKITKKVNSWIKKLE
ncbi:MAG: hypothetical protein QXN69_03690 [Candidatus Methanomethylicaceae archaeon]